MSLASADPGLGTVLLIVVVVVTPIATIAFARSGRGLRQLGRGRFEIDRADDPRDGGAGSPGGGDGRAEREDEVRQMVEAASYRRQARGEPPLDVESEVARALGLGLSAEAAQIRSEIRQVVIANNERRRRRGDPPLEVDAEVERRMREHGL